MPEQGPLRGLQSVLLGMLGDLSVRRVLERLADSARELVGASEAVVRLSAPDWAPLEVSSSSPERRVPEAVDPPPDDDPPGTRPWDSAVDGGRTLLSVPIRAHGAHLGELFLTGRGPFSPDEEDLVTGLAAAAGAAAWNARLYEEAQGRERWLDATLSVTADLVSGRGCVAGREFDLVAGRALTASQSVLALIAVPDGGAFRIAAAAGTVPSPTLLAVLAERLPQPTGHAQDGEAAIWLGTDATEGLGPLLAARLGRSPAAGVLLLARKEGSSYTRPDVSAAAVFCSNAALALRVRARGLGRDALAAERLRIGDGVRERIVPRLVSAGLSLRQLAPLAPAASAAALVEEVSRQLDTAVQGLLQTADLLGAGEDTDTEGTASFSADLLAAARSSAEAAGVEVQLTILGPTEAIPVDAGGRLLALTREVIAAAGDGQAGARIGLTVSAEEQAADLTVHGHSPAGQRRIRVPFVQHPSPA
jgi:GAF domain-containing protein